MPPQKKTLKMQRLALSATALLSTIGVPMLQGLTPAVNAAPVTAKSSDAFVDSMCVNTHLRYEDTVYEDFANIKQKLVELGFRHIRDTGSSDKWIARAKELAAAGIKSTIMITPDIGIVPNSSYWSNSPSYQIVDFIKNKLGPNVVDAVEMPNEIDIFYNNFYWRPGDSEKVNDNPNSPLYWGKYVESLTKDTWNAIKGDPATAGIKVIGPGLGKFLEIGTNPLPNLSAYVDWGNFHPYSGSGNSYGGYFSYNTINNGRYYASSNFPGVNVDEYPYAFQAYGPPFGGKPMAATETGYQTNTATDRYAVSEKVHAKYMPRLFLEFFRKDIPRTCSYELVDWGRGSFGLLRNDLSPKPAFTALKNLVNLLKDSGSFTPSSLDYTLTVNPPPGYDRTQYVHDLLLQKQNGKYYLVLWHEISNGDINSNPVREIEPPDMPTVVRLNTPISSATVYSLEEDGSMSSAPSTISNNTISIDVRDRVRVIELTPSN